MSATQAKIPCQPENTSHDVRKYQSIEIDPEMTHRMKSIKEDSK